MFMTIVIDQNEIGYAKDAAIVKQDNISTLHVVHERREKALSTNI